MKREVIILLYIVFSVVVCAQCEPRWYKDPPYKQYPGFGEGITKTMALDAAQKDAIKNLSLRAQLSVDPRTGEIRNGNIPIGNIQILKTETCKNDDSWYAYRLISVDVFKSTTNPVLAGIFSLVPGGGQLYKLEYTKASLFFVGTTGLLCTAYFFDQEMDEAFLASRNSKTLSGKQDNEKIGNNYKTARNISIGIAGALFLFNIYDAVFNEHKSRYDLSFNVDSDKTRLFFSYKF